MTSEIEGRIQRCYHELAAINNYHGDELSPYESRQLNDAYYALVDMFDKRRAKEFNDMMKKVYDAASS